MSTAEAGGPDWDREATTFDDEPDHGLRDSVTRDAWRRLLLAALPPAPADVADLGCGTGTLTVLLAEAGHRITGIDSATAMVAAARAKAAAAGVAVRLEAGDAAAPGLAAGSFDAVLCRHVLWALPDPDAALARWCGLLRPAGRLVLVEGCWSTGAGLTAAQTEALVRRHRDQVDVQPLTDPALWGRPVTDERYLVVSPA